LQNAYNCWHCSPLGFLSYQVDYLPCQWAMIKVDDIVSSSSLDEVLTDNKSSYNTGFYFLVFTHGKQNATRLYTILKSPAGFGRTKLTKVSFCSLCLLQVLLI